MSLPLVSPELPDTMPVLLARVIETEDEVLIQRCIETAERTHTRIGRPKGYCSWLEFLKAARGVSPEKLQRIAHIIVDLIVKHDPVWDYLEYAEFSYEIAGALLREMSNDNVNILRNVEKHSADHIALVGDDPIREVLGLKFKRLTVLLHPDV